EWTRRGRELPYLGVATVPDGSGIIDWARSLAYACHDPVLLAERAAGVLLHPLRHAAVVEGVRAVAPHHHAVNAPLRCRSGCSWSSNGGGGGRGWRGGGRRRGRGRTCRSGGSSAPRGHGRGRLSLGTLRRIRLASEALLHELESADGARVAFHVPRPHRARVPPLQRERTT
ncbi:hypothetical protein PMAYCL1PPCAC_03390, partial [Pristionchus mayeri]